MASKSDTEIAIEAHSLSKRYCSHGVGLIQPWRHSLRAGSAFVEAVSDCSFVVRRGEIVGITGSNGAGKSTLIKILARVFKPSSGSASLFGATVAMLDLSAGFHREMSVMDNLYFALATWGFSRKQVQDLVDSILQFAEYEGELSCPVKELSTGMWMRLALAAGLHAPADILLLDEVLSVGDIRFRERCRQLLVADTAKTVLVVSHEMELLRRYCDRVLWMQHGRIHMDGDARTVVQAYEAHSGTGARLQTSASI